MPIKINRHAVVKACLICTLNNIDFFTILIEELRTIRPTVSLSKSTFTSFRLFVNSGIRHA